MRKLISHTLLIVFLYFSFGDLIFFQVTKYHHHEKIEKAIKQNYFPDAVDLLIFDLVQFQNLIVEGENEFCWNGEMYDIIETALQGKYVLVKAIRDKTEEKLIHDYEDGQSEKSKSFLIYSNLIFEFTFIDLTGFLFAKFVSEFEFNLGYLNCISKFSPLNDSPPPRVL